MTCGFQFFIKTSSSPPICKYKEKRKQWDVAIIWFCPSDQIHHKQKKMWQLDVFFYSENLLLRPTVLHPSEVIEPILSMRLPKHAEYLFGESFRTAFRSRAERKSFTSARLSLGCWTFWGGRYSSSSGSVVSSRGTLPSLCAGRRSVLTGGCSGIDSSSRRIRTCWRWYFVSDRGQLHLPPREKSNCI